ncbi:MAG: hypothetical protein CMJ58_27005 [Planctomycetaceae bacterium]|nr:hypothetical protein [Planctomycetaceae bacterium]
MTNSDGTPDMTFDPTGPLERLRGDESLLLDMIGFYQADYEGLLQALRQSIDAEDWASAARAAHTLKGLASTFDAAKTMEAAVQVEAAARDTRTDELPKFVEQLEQSANALSGELAAYQQAHQAQN